MKESRFPIDTDPDIDLEKPRDIAYGVRRDGAQHIPALKAKAATIEVLQPNQERTFEEAAKQGLTCKFAQLALTFIY